MLAVFLYSEREPGEVMIGSDPTTLKLDDVAAETLGNTREWVEQALSYRPEKRPPLQALQGSIYGPDARL
jgi:hypothetical protein